MKTSSIDLRSNILEAYQTQEGSQRQLAKRFKVSLSFMEKLFKQKTAYEIRIRDWSSDVCSSDLIPASALDRFRGHACPRLARRRGRAAGRDVGRRARGTGRGRKPGLQPYDSKRRSVGDTVSLPRLEIKKSPNPRPDAVVCVRIRFGCNLSRQNSSLRVLINKNIREIEQKQPCKKWNRCEHSLHN